MVRRAMVVAAVLSVSCASQWKIHGGPKECAQMCQGWGMELVGMVGVGSQEASGPGATACVCEPPGKRAAGSGASGTAANTAAVVVALEAQQRQQAQASRPK